MFILFAFTLLLTAVYYSRERVSATQAINLFNPISNYRKLLNFTLRCLYNVSMLDCTTKMCMSIAQWEKRAILDGSLTINWVRLNVHTTNWTLNRSVALMLLCVLVFICRHMFWFNGSPIKLHVSTILTLSLITLSPFLPFSVSIAYNHYLLSKSNTYRMIRMQILHCRIEPDENNAPRYGLRSKTMNKSKEFNCIFRIVRSVGILTWEFHVRL